MTFEAVGTRTESIAVTLTDFELERILQEAYTLDQIIEELMGRLEAEVLVDIVCADNDLCRIKKSQNYQAACGYVKNKYKICDKRKDGFGIFLVEKDGEWDYHKDEYDDKYIRRLTPEETEEYDKVQSLRSIIDMMKHQ